MERRVSWSGLPEDLLTKIGQNLDTRFDIIRFRSVCRKWRNTMSLPFSQTQRTWHLPLTLSKDPNYHNPRNDSDENDHDSSFKEVSSSIVRTTVYILNQYHPISTPWLLKLEETEQGNLRILNPISDKPVKNLPTTFPKVLNLLDYSIFEVSRGYFDKSILKCISIQGGEEIVTSVSTLNVSKAVILPESDWIGVEDDFMILILRRPGKLLLGKNGDECLVQISEYEFYYDDIAVYRGRFVAVDRWGIVSFVDSSSSKLIQYTPPVVNGGQKKHLVVSSDHLFVVDRYFDRPRKSHNPYATEDAKVVSFKVYKLDEDLGWIEITSLDDRILFIGEGLNFFVPVKELSGCNGNYIYFIDGKQWYNDEEDELIGSTGHGIAVFDLVNRRIGKLSSFSGCSDMLWPPPSWFTAN